MAFEYDENEYNKDDFRKMLEIVAIADPKDEYNLISTLQTNRYDDRYKGTTPKPFNKLEIITGDLCELIADTKLSYKIFQILEKTEKEYPEIIAKLPREVKEAISDVASIKIDSQTNRDFAKFANANEDFMQRMANLDESPIVSPNVSTINAQSTAVQTSSRGKG